MKVILNQDVFNLGEEGDVRIVADGYARNFLIPRKMAVIHNKANQHMFDQKKKAIESRKEQKRKEAMGLKERLEAEVITIPMPAGEKGRLFGAVTSTTLVEELAKIGVVVERKKVEIPNHSLKMVGPHTVRVKLYGSEQVEMKVIIEGVQAEGTGPRQEKKKAHSAGEDELVEAGASEQGSADEENPSGEPLGQEG